MTRSARWPLAFVATFAPGVAYAGASGPGIMSGIGIAIIVVIAVVAYLIGRYFK